MRSSHLRDAPAAGVFQTSDTSLQVLQDLIDLISKGSYGMRFLLIPAVLCGGRRERAHIRGASSIQQHFHLCMWTQPSK
jgi:hypothetical protein